MTRGARGGAVALALALAAAACSQAPAPPSLLVTLGRGAAQDRAHEGDAYGDMIVRVELNRPATWPSRRILDGFAAVGVPSVSYDGGRALVAARRSAADPMQVWEVFVDGSAPRLIVAAGECHDPAYLPDDRIVYARSPAGTGSDAATSALYTADRDGGGESRITFGDASDRGPAVLGDGRIVFRRRTVGRGGPGKLFVVSPDGTGAALFSEPERGASIDGGPWPVEDRVVFAEQTPLGQQRLISVSVRQPAGPRELLDAEGARPDPGPQWFSSVAGTADGALAATVRRESGLWSVLRLAGGKGSPLGTIASSLSVAGEQGWPGAIGVALAAPRKRPLVLTSVVDAGKRTGTLLCLGVNASTLTAVAQAGPGEIRAVRVLGAGGNALGEAPVQADGSFFIEVPADTPLGLQLLGPNGVVAIDHSGLWVRPNENRGCIGCHEHSELAPDNRVPLALAHGATALAAAASANESAAAAAAAAMAAASASKSASAATVAAAALPTAEPAARAGEPASTSSRARGSRP